MGKYLPAVESDYLEIRLYAWQSRSIIDLSGAFRRTLENPWECAWFFLLVYIYIYIYINIYIYIYIYIIIIKRWLIINLSFRLFLFPFSRI